MERRTRATFARGAAMTQPPPRQVPRWAYGVPFLVVLVSAPLWLHTYEPGMFIAINQACAGIAAPVWTGLSLLGNAWALLAITAPLLVLAPRLLWAWLCAAPFAMLLARTGKGLIESPRPAAEIDNARIRIIGELLEKVSMPSGHTLTAFAVASGLYFALPRARRLRHSWLFVLAAGVGLSRMAVGAHWPGDVAVGAALGLLCGMWGQSLLAKISAAQCAPQSWGLRAVAGLMLLALYHVVVEELDFSENAPFQIVLAVVLVVSLAVFAWRSVRNNDQ